jgi:hypothetical protein
MSDDGLACKTSAISQTIILLLLCMVSYLHRGFFGGFFRLPVELWGGFLAGWPGLAYNENHESWLARIWYGLSFIVKLPLPVAFSMFTSIVGFSVFENLSLIQSVTPFLGEPESYEYKRNTDRIGDVAAKVEARKMIAESKVTTEVPVAFDDEEKESTSSPDSQSPSLAETDITNQSVEESPEPETVGA